MRHFVQPGTIGFLLIDGFALMSYASVVEPFRAANALAGRNLYSWLHVSLDGGPVRASNGANILADRRVGDDMECETLFIFAAGDPSSFRDPATFAWLRKLAKEGRRLAGVSGGPFLLARAGLLEGHASTIHWDHRVAFAEEFPDLSIEPGVYVIDRRRITCAGGTAGLDLAVELIEREQGHALAAGVSDWFIHTGTRAADRPQRLGLRERYGVMDDRVVKVLAHMEAKVEEPPARDMLAKWAGISTRQLERLFQAELGESINACYARIRLEQAHQLLRQTTMSMTEVSVACGFGSGSHFSRAFKAHYGEAPRAARAHATGLVRPAAGRKNKFDRNLEKIAGPA